MSVDRTLSVSHVSYSDFVNKELVAFSYYSNLRAIPHLMDGLKVEGFLSALFAVWSCWLPCVVSSPSACLWSSLTHQVVSSS